MYADSSFIQFSERGVWNGIARLTQVRNAVGSNDGHYLRHQLVLTPICIGTPAPRSRAGAVLSGKTGIEHVYLEMLDAIDPSAGREAAIDN